MKSEYEKMRTCEWYDANFDQELLAMRTEVQDACFQYNQTQPSNREKRKDLLEKIFGEVPEGLELVAPIWVDYGKHTRFGKGVFVNADSYFMDGALITIGSNVFIGPKCGFYTATHAEDVQKRNAGLERALPITIEDDVWIGANVSVMQGVTIGRGTVIGAGSVVTRDIPENVVAVGAPCKVVRETDPFK